MSIHYPSIPELTEVSPAPERLTGPAGERTDSSITSACCEAAKDLAESDVLDVGVVGTSDGPHAITCSTGGETGVPLLDITSALPDALQAASAERLPEPVKHATEGTARVVATVSHCGQVAAYAVVRPQVQTRDPRLLGRLDGLAAHAAAVAESRRLLAESEALVGGLLRSLVTAVDAKDPYTCGHSVRVALFAVRLAQEIGFTPEARQRLYLAGLLHDVGKIGVPDAVLRKPGRLTEDEFDQVRLHPATGHRILAVVPQVADALPAVLHHHERWDGRGYPDGLAGDASPLIARIMSVADAFDAMTSSRTYRRAMPLPMALEEVAACAAKQFDPELTRAFLNIPRVELADIAARGRPGPCLDATVPPVDAVPLAAAA
jgi:HD-GYP domain-containing protein (c-di-GMP phosphodiesterase class II)